MTLGKKSAAMTKKAETALAPHRAGQLSGGAGREHRFRFSTRRGTSTGNWVSGLSKESIPVRLITLPNFAFPLKLQMRLPLVWSFRSGFEERICSGS
jgi:hypothetical protein